MPCHISRNDNTSDARVARSTYYFSKQQKRPAGPLNSDPSSSSRKKRSGTSRKARSAQVGPHSPKRHPPPAHARVNGEPSNPERRPWFGSEPDVDHTFFRWDGIGQVPIDAVQTGIRDFHAGKHLATFSPEPKAGLVHVVANGMLQGHMSTCVPHARLLQIEFYLAECYRDMDLSLKLPPKWIQCFTLRRGDRTEELEWLKYQAELRWWKVTERNIAELHRLLEEPSDSEVNALFDSYTYHSQLPSSMNGTVAPHENY